MHDDANVHNYTHKQDREKANELGNESENGEIDDDDNNNNNNYNDREIANDNGNANHSTSSKSGTRLTAAEKKAIEKHRAAHYAPLLRRLHELFGKKEVHKVVLTKRHTR